MSEELKPCPFCGGTAEIVNIEDGENAGGGSCVCCTKCMASGHVEFEFKENFVSIWNWRTSDADIEKLRKMLRLALGHIDHMAAWITARKAGYSFESLGEDMDAMRAALGDPPGADGSDIFHHPTESE